MLDLSRIDWSETRHEGVALKVLRRDEASGDATVLIRMRPGCSYPAHRHAGLEEVFILQGGYRDAAGEHRAGDYVLNDAGSAHRPTALAGEDCVMLAVAHSGIELLKP
ncbi:MAG TPA: cupin domain-containing protein [Pyrinomonadaceae bacterium]|jgi:putative transcriptional regulator|nr:cupin domain-containing protein [Pyrinomonadaceae bacterium]